MSAFEKAIISIVFLVCIGAFLDQTTEIGTRFWQDMEGNHNMYAVYEDDKYGYINARGRVEIEPQFQKVDPVFEGDLSPAMHVDQGAWGYINRSGNWVIWPRYSWARDFSDGLAAVAIENPMSYSYGFIDKKGLISIEPRFSDVRDFHEGLAGVKLGSRWGFINDIGMFIVAPDYQAVKDFSEDRVAVKKAGAWGVISNLSEQKTEFSYDDIGTYSEGLVPARRGGYWGYLDLEGNIVIPFKYLTALSFSEGLGLVQDITGWKYINTEDKVMISQPRFVDARPFSDGLAAVKMLPKGAEEEFESQWGYIDHDGKIVIEPKYDVAMDFVGGLASVGLDDTAIYRGYINKEDEFVWKPLNLASFGQDRTNYGMYLLIFGLIVYGAGLIRVFMRDPNDEIDDTPVPLRPDATSTPALKTPPTMPSTSPLSETGASLDVEETINPPKMTKIKPVEPTSSATSVETPMPQAKVVKSYEEVDEDVKPVQLAGKFDEYQEKLDTREEEPIDEGFFKPIQLAKTPGKKKKADDDVDEKGDGWFKPIQLARTPKKKK